MFKKRDPVCGVKVSKRTPHVFVYNRKVYYFDCEACRETFISDLPTNIEKKKTGGFLAWIASGSKNIPKSCHQGRLQREVGR